MVSNETMKDYWNNAKLDDLLDGMSRTSFMLRFTLSNPHLDTTIVGTGSIDHLHDNVAVAAQGPLPDDVLNEAKDRLAAAGAKPTPS
jgi:aryl-alcohol dehydrogenase-like predicted oxidoreductase